jgi:predicted dehydrogenase
MKEIQMTRFAFMGLRHGHIMGMLKAATERDDVEVVAVCEEDAATRETLTADGTVKITHDSYAAAFDGAEFDVVAIGDYYSARGPIAIEALKRGKHVIIDKPISTSLEELDQMEALAKEKGLIIGAMLDVRDSGVFLKIRELVQSGAIGKVHAISFGGQHPLMYGTRPAWYFEEGKHGGTINDIAIHAIDAIPWITGSQFATINAARSWNACCMEVPHFLDSAQMMMTLENGCGVMGDVSYLMPDGVGYTCPLYWRMTLWGQDGLIEANYSADAIKMWQGADKELKTIKPAEAIQGGYLESFLREINGETEGLHLSSAEVLRSSRVTLLAQQAADQNLTNVSL